MKFNAASQNVPKWSFREQIRLFTKPSILLFAEYHKGKKSMFFFIGGIQPKTVTLDEHPSMCPSCGLYQARQKRIDHYISIFFLPIIRIKKGVPFMTCEKCGWTDIKSQGALFKAPPTPESKFCSKCGKQVDIKFQYCPFCGTKL